MKGRFPTDGLGTEVQGLLNSGAGIEEKRQQGVIALAFDCRTIRLSENRGDIVLVHNTDFRFECLLGGNAQDRGALGHGQWFTVGDELEKAV